MKNKEPWVSNQPEKLPDFIIGGAMKSGTSSIHQILNKHPDIFIAKDELGFFDIDNICEHPDFNYFDNDKVWRTQNLDQDPKIAWSWYYDKFKESDRKIKGEDSTTYLASSIAAQRISKQSKEIKMIFVLRHPTARTISNYFHLLKSGRIEHSLEDTLQYNPNIILRRSLYADQLSHYYKYFNPNNIKIILFEDFITNKERVFKELCTFLEISYDKFSKEDFNLHINKTKYPKSQKIQLLYNRLNRSLRKTRYSNFTPFKHQNKTNKISFREKLLKKIHKKINPLRETYKPKIHMSTKKYLDDFFKENLRNIDDVTGEDIFNKWFKH